MNERADRRRHTRCSFCGKSQRQVKKLIAGPGVYICDECIDLCNEIIDDIILSTARPSDPAAKDGRLELSTAGSGRPDPRPEPEREGPKTSR